MDKIDKIKRNHKMIWKKTKFIELVADFLGLNYGYIRINYFSRGWNIPESYQDRILELQEQEIKNQE